MGEFPHTVLVISINTYAQTGMNVRLLMYRQEHTAAFAAFGHRFLRLSEFLLLFLYIHIYIYMLLLLFLERLILFCFFTVFTLA